MATKQSPTKAEEKTPFNIYQDMTLGTLISFLRLYEYNVMSISMQLFSAMMFQDKSIKEKMPVELESFIKSFNPSMSKLENFRYVSNVSILIYSYALLDTFLTETTKLIILLHPTTIKELDVKFDKILKCKNRNEIIYEVVEEKSKIISFDSIKKRIAYLKKTFKINVQLSHKDYERLDKLTNTRNTIVHNESFLKLILNDTGQIGIDLIDCPYKPRKVNYNECIEAADFFKDIVGKIYSAVRTTLFSETLDNHNDCRITGMVHSRQNSQAEVACTEEKSQS